MKNDTTSQEFFEEKYLRNPDPWSFDSSSYETARYHAMFNSLKGERYDRAFEPGCSIGVFTVRLASLCRRVEALDLSQTAVAHARARCKGLPNVNITCGALPKAMPDGSFDLVVLSEIGYYFTEEQLALLAKQLIEKIRPNGLLLATHWLGNSADHILSGDRVHQIIGASPGLASRHSERHAGFRLNAWNRQ